MLGQKNKTKTDDGSGQINKCILNDFCDLLFTAKSKTFYQKSYAVLVAYNPYEIDEYVKKQKLVGDGNEKESNN